jgi:uncharacterized protein YmfQ (DUF2313 family)
VNTPLALPTEASDAGDAARRLATLVGPAVQAPEGSAAAADYYALGQALVDARATNNASLDEAFADTATQLLSELEAQYGLTPRPDMALADRRARLVAKIRAARAGTPNSILTAVHAIDPTAVLYENTAADVAATNPRGVFIWALQIAEATYFDAEKRRSILAIVEQMKPAYTQGNTCVTVGFLTDDDESLTDRDVLDE